MKLSDLLLHAPKGLWGEELKNGESGVPVIKTNNLTYEGHINFTDLTYRSIDNHDAVPNYLQKGDLLVEKSGGTKTHSVGYINYFDGENQKYVANNFILVLRPNEQLVSSKYLFYQMKYKYESGQIRNCYEQTTGIQNLRVKSYLQKEVLCPSRTIQNDVALSLDSITSAILIEKASLLSADELIKSRFNEIISLVGTRVKLMDLCSGKPEYGAQSSSVPYVSSRPRYIRITDINDDGTLNNDVVCSSNIDDDFRCLSAQVNA